MNSDDPHKPVRRFAAIDSTNSEAQRLAAAGEAGPLWIRADVQTAGRGRLGRHWVSEPGNLHATLLFPVAAGPVVAAQVSFVAALAVHDVVSRLLPAIRVAIKWPNDVLVGGAKVAGILAEVVGSAPTRVALGCGLNVAHAPEGTPYPVTALAHHGVSLSIDSIFEELGSALWQRLRMWDEGRGFAAIRRDWLERAVGLGGLARSGEIEGRFVGLAADGALMLELPGGHRRLVHAGDVRFAELDALRAGSR
ncbi:MAG: biotin--[acetyl-CoA-carboxylase] ligase [Rhizobiales bacterium]|nr:biotin--[acetyl-CoA-carboxylase] ligase [Hyphomicrobiales bacterium]MBI3672554.1 biotin--[acetyl-CoA-carboxylase] ligase [Hyphomicrobiales bacterium]